MRTFRSFIQGTRAKITLAYMLFLEQKPPLWAYCCHTNHITSPFIHSNGRTFLLQRISHSSDVSEMNGLSCLNINVSIQYTIMARNNDLVLHMVKPNGLSC